MKTTITWVKPNGEWGIDGVDLTVLPSAVYGALYKLMLLEHREGFGNEKNVRR